MLQNLDCIFFHAKQESDVLPLLTGPFPKVDDERQAQKEREMWANYFTLFLFLNCYKSKLLPTGPQVNMKLLYLYILFPCTFTLQQKCLGEEKKKKKVSLWNNGVCLIKAFKILWLLMIFSMISTCQNTTVSKQVMCPFLV